MALLEMMSRICKIFRLQSSSCIPKGSVFRNTLKSVHLEISTPHLPRQEGYCKISPLPPPALPTRTDSLEMWYSGLDIACKSGSWCFITSLPSKQEYIPTSAIRCLNHCASLQFYIAYWFWHYFTARIKLLRFEAFTAVKLSALSSRSGFINLWYAYH
jgi:hypothetical protein